MSTSLYCSKTSGNFFPSGGHTILTDENLIAQCHEWLFKKTRFETMCNDSSVSKVDIVQSKLRRSIDSSVPPSVCNQSQCHYLQQFGCSPKAALTHQWESVLQIASTCTMNVTYTTFMCRIDLCMFRTSNNK